VFKWLCKKGDISLKGKFQKFDVIPYIVIKRSANPLTQNSTVFYLLQGQRLIHLTANKIPPAFLTPKLTCYKRYMTRLIEKMGDAYSGLIA
jgi:hypothetical protein